MALSSTVGSSQSFSYTGSMQSVSISVPGIYKLEVYGSAGKTPNSSNPAGKGGYAVGYKKIESACTLYVAVGGQSCWNGGGYGSENGGNGGDATHIATSSGLLKNLSSSTVLIVAGGGGGSDYEDWSLGYGAQGGSGGGTNGGNGVAGGNQGCWEGTGGTQTRGGYNCYGAEWQSQTAGFGFGAYSSWCGGGGGGGWYGGGYGDANNGAHGGGGGSGYIGNVPSFTYNGTTYSPSMTNGSRSGTGYATITLMAALSLPVYYDGTQIQKLYYDGTQVTSLYFNGTKLY